MAMRGSRDIREGMGVFDVDGDKVGSVEEVAGGGVGYMKVKTGLLGLGGSWYIPFDAVREVRSDRVYLSADNYTLSGGYRPLGALAVETMS